MKYLFCYAYQHPTRGVAHGDAITTLEGALTEASLTKVREGLARQLGVGPNQMSFTSVVQLAA